MARHLHLPWILILLCLLLLVSCRSAGKSVPPPPPSGSSIASAVPTFPGESTLATYRVEVDLTTLTANATPLHPSRAAAVGQGTVVDADLAPFVVGFWQTLFMEQFDQSDPPDTSVYLPSADLRALALSHLFEVTAVRRIPVTGEIELDFAHSHPFPAPSDPSVDPIGRVLNRVDLG